MATTTVLINAQSIGTGSNYGDNKFETKRTMAGSSTVFVIEAKVVNGAAGYARSQTIRIRFATSGFDQTAAEGMTSLGKANFLDISPTTEAGKFVIMASDAHPLKGGYLYVWCDVPKVDTAQTLTVQVTEY